MRAIPLGLTGRFEITPGAAHTAAAAGNTGVEVVGTPFLVGYFENAAHRAILSCCDAGEVTVGTRIEVDHLAAALPDRPVVAEAEVIAVEGRRVTFAVAVRQGERVLMKGRHGRAIVKLEMLLARAARWGHQREKEAMSVAGNWTIAMETPLGTRHASLALTAEGGALRGTMSGEAGTTEIADGRVSGNDIAFSVDITQPMTMTLEFSAKVTGDAMTGSVKLGMFGTAPLTGTRA